MSALAIYAAPFNNNENNDNNNNKNMNDNDQEFLTKYKKNKTYKNNQVRNKSIGAMKKMALNAYNNIDEKDNNDCG